MLASTPGDTDFSPRMAIFAFFWSQKPGKLYHRKTWLVTGFEKSVEITVLGLIRVSQEKNPPSFLKYFKI